VVENATLIDDEVDISLTDSSGRITGKPEMTTWLLTDRRLSLAHNMSGVFGK
jgi:hypothetical protein